VIAAGLIVKEFRSALAAESLQKMGYENVISMEGGWKGWNRAGGEVE